MHQFCAPPTPDTPAGIVLRLTCPDRPGILSAVSPALAADGWDIRSAMVYGDPDTRTFFVRMELAGAVGAVGRLTSILDPFRATLGLDWDIRDTGRPMKVLVAVSQTDHCLNDIIHKARIGRGAGRSTGPPTRPFARRRSTARRRRCPETS